MEVSLHPIVTLADVAQIPALMGISALTFVETYGAVNTEENMRDYLASNFSEAALAAQMAEQGTRFYLLMFAGKCIGYLKLNSGAAQTELKDQNALEIERIYVLKEFQGQGFGRLLLDTTRRLAGQEHAEFIWLGVWEKNISAIGFYSRMGFTEFNRHIFMLGADEQMDLMMKLKTN